ncbi:hypothetical protein KC333_g6740 [Hortaea werneckii]|nr:hypothetical protein KC333_g6740 [Hortaea werneckii]KAI7310539.1 hypothetical protein KC326_g6643 [Hortaea werneckii]
MSSRFTLLPAELQIHIIELAACEDRVICLGNFFRDVPYPYMVKYRIPSIIQVNKGFRKIGLKAYFRHNTFGIEIWGRDNGGKQDQNVWDLCTSLRHLPGFANDLTIPSLNIRHLHVHLPFHVRFNISTTNIWDPTIAKKKFLSEIIFDEDDCFGPLLDGSCAVSFVEYDHKEIFITRVARGAVEHHTKEVRLTEKARTTISVAKIMANGGLNEE